MAPIIPFKGQKYEELRKQHGPDNLFEDPEFPANDKSLFYKRASPGTIEWKRPGVRMGCVLCSCQLWVHASRLVPLHPRSLNTSHWH